MVLPCFFFAFAVKQSNSAEGRGEEGQRGATGDYPLLPSQLARSIEQMELFIHSP